MKSKLSRRTAIRRIVGTAAAVMAASPVATHVVAQEDPASPAPGSVKGRINHSACRWCYRGIELEELCRAGKEMGLVAMDLIDPADFPVLKKNGLVCSMVNFPSVNGMGGIARAWNRLEHHDILVEAYEQRLKEAAEAGYERVICFSGNRAGLDDEKGLENCAVGLKRILSTAERLKVTLCMELLNSKRGHIDYQCDHTSWGVELVRRINSERFKLLYDIFHMQIMDGDICDTITENHQFIDHYHTGGVPGRGEIDDSQELNYPRIMKAILDTGFKGYVAQEFIPKRADKLASLRQAVQLCDV